MRRCIKNKNISTQKILVTNEDKIIGINLGYDFIKEHDNGVQKMRNFFNIEFFDMGENGYKIKKQNLNNHLLFDSIIIDESKCYCLLFSTKEFKTDTLTEDIILNNDLYPFDDIFDKEDELYPGLFTSWSSGAFGILAKEEYLGYLENLLVALKDGDMLLDPHTENFFPDNGLTLCIASRTPEFIKEEISKQDLSDLKLIYEFEGCGIKNILRQANCKYTQLTPKWKDEENKIMSFYLCPKDTISYNAGWYTYEDLMDWSQGKGNIIKKKSHNYLVTEQYVYG